jgi:hypothetical protein
MRRLILRWELLGFLFILAAGFPWHFVFQWIGGWRPAALIFPVNESVWEHMKLCFWPGLIWALIENPFIGKGTLNFWAAKAVSLLAMCTVMAAVFYAYVAVLGASVLWANLLDFALAAAAGQYIGYRVMVRQPLGFAARRVGAILLVVQVVVFLTFSFFPPHFILFRDPVTRVFGIPARQ